MLVLSGGSALSDARRGRLLANLQRTVPAVTGLDSCFIHFVDYSAELTAPESDRLQQLLAYGEPGTIPGRYYRSLLVVPRLGTISPWATKATDIAHNCGLGSVRRIERGIAHYLQADALDESQLAMLRPLLHDRMTQTVIDSPVAAASLFHAGSPAPLTWVTLGDAPHRALQQANAELGLALSDDEIEYLRDHYTSAGRDPTQVELMMFAQANSEHCRHKIFNADWVVDGVRQPKSLFGMIRYTHEQADQGVLSAYRDNAAVIAGHRASRLHPHVKDGAYQRIMEPAHFLIKVETHNHPTAISPFPGAATGSGGEIRDEGATGTGSKPKAGLTGFSVSNLRIPGFEQPWEYAWAYPWKDNIGKPGRIASALEIMRDAPIGAAAFNNEFGRPNLAGYFRTFEQVCATQAGEEIRGYHKPIMVAGGLGNIRAGHIDKRDLPVDTPIVVLGGPAMLIGLGGGAASSVASGASDEALDFASVQRDNPEMQRRCQEVIDRCAALGEANPIRSIHDVGAGGLSNAIPEILATGDRGGCLELRAIPSDEPQLSPEAIWCNEAQERYVLAIDADTLDAFKAICAREHCPHAVVGKACRDARLLVSDRYFANTPVDMPMQVLLGKPPRMLREAQHRGVARPAISTNDIDLHEAAERILRLPAVASKTFLIAIGDRTVSGLVARDQMVGPWQVPVADVAVTLSDYDGYTGEAMAMGERAPVALASPPASGRMAVAEALLNIAAAPVEALADVRLSANWMAAAGHPGEDAALYDTVRAVGEELCPALGIAIPVGKDSLSMKTVWHNDGIEKSVTAPLSLIVSAFAPIADARATMTPQLRTDAGETELIFIDLGQGRQRLAGSALAQVYSQVGDQPPDLDDPACFKAFFTCLRELKAAGLLLAYHDRSDGGLFATLCEMAFAGHTGIAVELDALGTDPAASLFNEELGALIQVRTADSGRVRALLREAALQACSHVLGRLTDDDHIAFIHGGQSVFTRPRAELHRRWSETSYHMQALRDNRDCARQEFEALGDPRDPGLTPHLGFDPDEDITAPYAARGIPPAVAILREQGVNGQLEMAAAFDRAGFRVVDVHMSDLIAGRRTLAEFQGIAACGGFSYGDVLGAGGGWAHSIRFNDRARDAFAAFFARGDVFGLGVCNGCQMLSRLYELIPGAEHWPRFIGNASEQFEARLSLVEVLPSPSILLQGMQGSVLPIAVAHGEGYATFPEVGAETVEKAGLVALRYVDHYGQATEGYPDNPNGSPRGITGLTTIDGRFTIMMPHPERVFRTIQHSWHPPEWGEDGPWLRLFRNARAWLN